jgi:putative tryptophan/tyrosine transport system substrate-binding protein
MKRRDLIAALGGAAALPFVARAQQSTMPVIGFLDSRSPEALTDRLRGFRRGLGSIGYVEGESVAIVYRWAENQIDRLPMLASEFARRPVSVIVASGGPDVVLAAKAVTSTIPIVFLTAEDPVRLGLVASLARPGSNLTGINFLNRELTTKQLELLRELVPGIRRVAVIINPSNPTIFKSTLQEIEQSGASGLQLDVMNASTSREIDAAFATFAQARPDAVFVSQDPFLNSRRLQLSMLAMRHGLPASYSGREYAEAGGLLSYGSDINDVYREVGVYCGRVLKGAKPADLPVIQSTKFELVINAQTARILGLTVPQTLLAIADEVIE